MRVSALLVAMGMASGALATAAPAAEPPTLPAADQTPMQPLKYRRLDSEDALENLRSSNPRHYAIARKILAAANEICDAQKGAPLRMKFEAHDVGCTSSFWFTSNPPKRALRFRIEDTVYTALVEVRNLGAKAHPADPAWATPK
jgi:hypothetical protein